ncbi:MAG: response regulator [Nitrospirae bacterium]|nr:response regulator [Nitrospirota bacterium]MDA8213764.1 response regulator [Nitrospiraceae bacterium]
MGEINILIIDDEPLIITSLLEYLSERGYDVVATNSSKAAVSLINADRFDVVITDLRMKPFSGIDIIKQLRGAGFAGKIILMSAFCEEYKQEMEALNVDAYFEKPFLLQDIHKKIKEWTN